jgi:hypothetical protein
MPIEQICMEIQLPEKCCVKYNVQCPLKAFITHIASIYDAQ